jgi:hypothetical protein
VVEIASPAILEITRLFYSTANISLINTPDNLASHGMPLGALKSESLEALLWMFRFVARRFITKPSNAAVQLKSSYSDSLSQEYEAVRETTFILSEWPERLLDAVYQNISSQTGGSTSSTSVQLLTGLTQPTMPQLFQQIGHAFIESSRLLHSEQCKVDEQTLEHARLRVGSCCY